MRTLNLHLVSASWKFSQRTKKFDFGLQMASEVRFGICGPNCICNHVCFGCLGLCSFVARKKIKIKMNRPLLDLSASPQVKKVWLPFAKLLDMTIQEREGK